MNLIVLDCSRINKWLIDQINMFIDTICMRVYEENSKLNVTIIDSFNKIYLKLLTPPDNADECMDLLKYLDYSRMEESFKLRV